MCNTSRCYYWYPPRNLVPSLCFPDLLWAKVSGIGWIVQVPPLRLTSPCQETPLTALPLLSLSDLSCQAARNPIFRGLKSKERVYYAQIMCLYRHAWMSLVTLAAICGLGSLAVGQTHAVNSVHEFEVFVVRCLDVCYQNQPRGCRNIYAVWMSW